MKISCSIIGSKCRTWRVAHGYTQRQIAEELGYKQPTISKFEYGKNDNCGIFLWYLMHGFNADELRGEYSK